MSVDKGRMSAPGFSFAKFVLFSLGAGAIVLIVSIPIIYALAHWSPYAGLFGALVAIVLMIAVIGVVSRRMIAGVERQMLADTTDSTPPTDRNTPTDG